MLCWSILSLLLSDKCGSSWTTNLHSLLLEGAPLGCPPLLPYERHWRCLRPPLFSRERSREKDGYPTAQRSAAPHLTASSEQNEQLFAVPSSSSWHCLAWKWGWGSSEMHSTVHLPHGRLEGEFCHCKRQGWVWARICAVLSHSEYWK